MTEALRPTLSKSIVNVYFEPKPWESKKLYERLGVKRFQKILKSRAPAYRMPSKSQGAVEEKYELDKFTEGVHTGISVFMMTCAVLELHLNAPLLAASLLLINIPTNMYPIFSARYNRIKFNRIHELNNKRENQRRQARLSE